MVIVPRPDGEVRICIDMHSANRAIIRQPYAMPTFEGMMPHVGRGHVFSKLDIK